VESIYEMSGENNVQTIDRAFDILNLLKENEKGMGVSDIAKRLDLSAPTTHRILQSLVFHKYVKQNSDNKHYELGVSCLELGRSFLDKLNLREVAGSILKKLRDDCRESVSLGIIDGTEVVFIDKFDALMDIAFVGSVVGSRSPAYCTAVGKVLLAYHDGDYVRKLFNNIEMKKIAANTITNINNLLVELDIVRLQGYAISSEEIEDDLKCIAAPIWQSGDFPISALGVGGPINRIDQGINENNLIEKLVEAGREISYYLNISNQLYQDD